MPVGHRENVCVNIGKTPWSDHDEPSSNFQDKYTKYPSLGNVRGSVSPAMPQRFCDDLSAKTLLSYLWLPVLRPYLQNKRIRGIVNFVRSRHSLFTEPLHFFISDDCDFYHFFFLFIFIRSATLRKIVLLFYFSLRNSVHNSVSLLYKAPKRKKDDVTGDTALPRKRNLRPYSHGDAIGKMRDP